MKKLLMFGLAAVFSLSVCSMNFTDVSAEPEKDMKQVQQVKLTEEQKSELDALYKEMLKTKKQIIMKYEDFGVLSSEKADKKMEWMEKHYEMMKENDFIPKKRHHHKKYGKDEKTAQ